MGGRGVVEGKLFGGGGGGGARVVMDQVEIILYMISLRCIDVTRVLDDV